jgi:hypothetical protein
MAAVRHASRRDTIDHPLQGTKDPKIILLGALKAIPAQAEVGLPMVALVTMFGALESFFNWRSRWVLMEEAQYRLNRLRDEMDYYLMVTPSDGLEREKPDQFFEQLIWSDVSRRWIEFRALDASPPSGRTTFSGVDTG